MSRLLFDTIRTIQFNIIAMVGLTRDSALLGLVLFCAFSGAVFACGPSSDCTLDDRHYRIRLPDNLVSKQKIGAIFFQHGYQGSAAGVMRNKHLARVAQDLGVALIATKSAGLDWAIPGSPSMGSKDPEDELQYFDNVRTDVLARYPIDPDRIMVTGFSAGGMMTWNLACHRPADYAAFAPMAGTFWKPIPENCSKPVVNIIHVHGNRDRTVPLVGRKIGPAHQGAIREALEMYANFGSFGPVSTRQFGLLTCEDRVNNDDILLRFCLFDGRHSFKSSYVKTVWNMFFYSGRL